MFRGCTAKRRKRWGNGDTGINVIMFPRAIDPECKEDVSIAKQFLEKIDGLMMKGLRGGSGGRRSESLGGRCGRCEGRRIFVRFD